MLPIDKVETSAVLSALKSLWHEEPEAASRARALIESVCEYAKAYRRSVRMAAASLR
jgi:hypothetical protein